MPVFWRTWVVDSSGWLYAPYASASTIEGYGDPWPSGEPARAWCHEHGHDAPVLACECGIRGMWTPRDALTIAAMAGWLNLSTWTVPPLLADRVTLVIGQAELSGRIIGPSPNDPTSSMKRAEYAKPAGTLYVTPNAGPFTIGGLEANYYVQAGLLRTLITELART